MRDPLRASYSALLSEYVTDTQHHSLELRFSGAGPALM